MVFRYKVDTIRIDHSITTLIAGDSHTQSGLDDSLINNSLNISQSDEHFLYTYNVLRLLLDNNHQINKVILGVSFHSFAKSYDATIQSDEYTKVMFPKYFPILDSESVTDTGKMTLTTGVEIFKNIVKSVFNNSTIHGYSFIGSFYKRDRSNLNDNSINAAIQRHYYTKSGSEQAYADYQVKYLKKIVDLCHAKNIELIIVNTPIPDAYYQKIPEKFTSYYYSIMQQFKNKIQFYDFHAIELPQTDYEDGDHLNSQGAKIFSPLINERISTENETATY